MIAMALNTRASIGLVILGLLCCSPNGTAQPFSEILLSDSENAYNPIPSPDGTMVAYVCTGRWGKGTGGFGRSNLKSIVKVMSADGLLITEDGLAETFLAGWTRDGRALVCYRDWRYSLVSLDGRVLLEGEIPESTGRYSRPERRWLTNREIVFDRISDEQTFNTRSRLWKVTIAQ